ncbi:MAG: M23 family metallopeptidase [Ignavibacteria bacterium]|nr:M23 family metallopeptidase [Ignavibacteria bacterium]MBT8392620.1 M23 family metallopeptidase [Ignavibacteria bacterium]NNJ51621.1 M23 family metallopeptidase [Ignavibacteriaceae bacterium]NNL20295.1 M23 family metallopeptidase [Ignavibacteriaceae bacterium]
MKKYFYFSKSSLKFIEIKNFKSKAMAVLIGGAFVLTSLFVIAYFIIGRYFDSNLTSAALKKENDELTNKLKEITISYQNLRAGIDSLSVLNSELRNTANLKRISSDELMLGIGGSDENYFNKINSSDFEVDNALKLVDEMIRKFEFEKNQLGQIEKQIELNNELFECIPAIKPTEGIYSIGGFGMRKHPILGVRKFHSGLDINNNYGTPVYAPGNGKVISVGRNSGYGLVVEIDHGFGYKTIYAHLSKVLVKKGQQVIRGQQIAKSGNSGLSSGPHLHYEVHHHGKKLNPVDFFFDDINLFNHFTNKNKLISSTE